MKSFADANSVLSGFVPTDSAEEPYLLNARSISDQLKNRTENRCEGTYSKSMNEIQQCFCLRLGRMIFHHRKPSRRSKGRTKFFVFDKTFEAVG